MGGGGYEKRFLFCTVLTRQTVQEQTKLQSQRGRLRFQGKDSIRGAQNRKQNGWKNARVKNEEEKNTETRKLETKSGT